MTKPRCEHKFRAKRLFEGQEPRMVWCMQPGCAEIYSLYSEGDFEFDAMMAESDAWFAKRDAARATARQKERD